MDPLDIIPGSLSHGGDDGEVWFGIIYSIVAIIIFLAYAKSEFSLVIAILYSLFWPYGLLYTWLF